MQRSVDQLNCSRRAVGADTPDRAVAATEPPAVTLWRMRRALVACGVLAAAALGPMTFAMATTRRAQMASRRTARIAGRVLVCNVPEHCMTRRFKVSAQNSSGRRVARTTTHGRRNRFALHVPPGSYRLVATSSGLVCKASAAATAHRTTYKNITCLVP